MPALFASLVLLMGTAKKLKKEEEA